MAAAIGAGLPIHEPTGNMVVDIGGGTTEVAVISLGGIVTSTSIRIGGDELDEAIIQHVKKEYSLLLGERTSEAIKLAIASVFPMPEELVAEIKGRDLVSGLPKTITISAEEIRRAIEEPVNAIIDAIKTTLDRTPPELAADIMDRGIVLTGGGALLRGLDKRLRHETGMPVRIADTPLQAVVLGSGKCLEEFEVLQRVLVSPTPAVTRRVAPARAPAARGSWSSALVAASLAIITLDYRQGDAGPLAGMGRAAQTFMAPLQEGVTTVTRPVGDFFSGLAHLPSLARREPGAEGTGRDAADAGVRRRAAPGGAAAVIRPPRPADVSIPRRCPPW